MIELNLLPDVKLDYIKSQRTQRLALSISVLAGGLSIALLVILLSVSGLQKKHLGDLNTDIKKDTRRLQQEPQIDKILTVQNQLQSLTDLHASKPAATRLLDYLNQVTPAQASITDFTVDFTTQQMSVTGSADALATVNKYVDTLKFTTYTTKDSNTQTKAFSDVVLSSFGLSPDGKNSQPASFTITYTYDKNIFDITQEIKLIVPKQTTTRATLDQSSDLFTGTAQPAAGGGQ
jgi:hypothetical protein